MNSLRRNQMNAMPYFFSPGTGGGGLVFSKFSDAELMQ
jgi:hypothetical protein